MSYTVTDRNGCKVIEGRLPLGDCGVLLGGWADIGKSNGEEWIADALLSSHLGVCMVVGPKDACYAWRRELGLEPPKDAPGGPLWREREDEHGNTYVDVESATKARYRLVAGKYPGIECLQCGRISYNSNDITHRFCGACDDYLGE